MAKTLKEVLADPKAFPDDTKFTLGELETTLGDLRGLSKAEQERISTASAQLQQEKATLEAAQRTLAENFSKLVDAGMVTIDKATGQFMFAQPNPSSNPNPNPKSGEPVNYEQDSYVGPLFKQLKALETQIVKYNEGMTQLQRDLTGSRTLYETDRLRNEFVRHADWPEGYDFDRAIKETAGRKLHDDYGRLNVTALHDELSKPLRFSQKEFDTQVQQKAEELATAQRASLATRPGMGTRTAVKPEFKNIDEAINAASQDPDIQRGLQGILPVQ